MINYHFEITKGSIVLLECSSCCHTISVVILKILNIEGYLDELIATVKYGFIFALIATLPIHFSDGDFSISRQGLPMSL